jgi:hypothetical protein
VGRDTQSPQTQSATVHVTGSRNVELRENTSHGLPLLLRD